MGCVSKDAPAGLEPLGTSFETPFLTEWLLGIRAQGVIGQTIRMRSRSMGAFRSALLTGPVGGAVHAITRLRSAQGGKWR